MGIRSKIEVVEFDTLAEFLEDMCVSEGSGHWQDRLEEEYPDMSVFVDENLESHIDTLTYNGIDEEEIIKRATAVYGNVIDFYNVSDTGYIMMYGVR